MRGVFLGECVCMCVLSVGVGSWLMKLKTTFLCTTHKHTYQLELPTWKNNNWSQFLLVTFHSLHPLIHCYPVSDLSHPASEQEQSHTPLWPLRTHRNLIFLLTRQLGPRESDPLLDLSQTQQWHFRGGAAQIPASLLPQYARGHRPWHFKDQLRPWGRLLSPNTNGSSARRQPLAH